MRAIQDRDRIAGLARQLRASAEWRRVGKPLQALEDLAHGLAGASGMFGFHSVGEAAAKVERLAERWRMDPPAKLTPRRAAILDKATASLLAALRTVDEN